MKRSTFRLLFSAPTRHRLTLGTLGTVATGFADAAGVALIVPLMQLLSGAAVDQGVLRWLDELFGSPGRETLAMYLAIITFGAFFLKGVAVIGFRWWLLGFLGREEAEMSTRLLRYFLNAPYGLHLKRSSADFIRVINDAVHVVFKQSVIGVMNIISELVTIIAVSITLVILVPVPAFLLLAYFLLIVALFYSVVRPAAKHAGTRLISSIARVYEGAMHALGGIKEIRIRHKAPYFLRRYSRARHDYAAAEHTAAFLGELPKYLFEVAFILGIAGISLYIFATMTPAESVSALAALTAAGFRLLPSVTRLVSSMSTVRLGRPSYEVVLADLRDAELAEENEAADDQVTAPFARLRRDVRFDNVTFTHDGRERPAVDNVSITVPVGESVALVGPSGAGKSTIVDLLLGLYAPESGTIRADGIEIHDMLPAWQQSVGLVPQEVYLLDDSLRANIAFGEEPEDVDPVRLAEAIDGAQLTELVAQLPEGLDTFIGERGIRLSGGQRQRIGIARALYTKPQLLVLDEATSALDNETEQRISETIANLHGTVTIVIIAHRLSTVRDCNEVIFLQDGRVAAAGGFDELQLLNDDFARLVKLGSLK
ncbi:ABC transporter ATP-binding protein [Agromyces larvae]|uniref:ABC transporter ATP-binding protein/permease n=1 Tax=Agromyces larvae TaxID=2929802 RepID=A0ABY4BU76_9MICO|nr:ABC transporter ATP-binding protein [Agromyces larvae]UOE42757.1 ABC transporter ATP-binding protein/permease [Agromyces larvae]